MRVGNSGYAAIYHISAISMEHAAGVKFIHVPYKGGAPAIPALLGGHLDAASLSPTDAYHLVKAGKLRAIGVTSPVRSKFVPDAQTFKELGLNVDDITYFSWAAPKGVAKERIRILHDAIKKGVESKEFKEYCDSQAVTIAPMGPEEFAKFLVKEDVKWKETIMIGGIKPE
jgi:tripartite-type tricarboxylate transporter receptor subunit TctC